MRPCEKIRGVKGFSPDWKSLARGAPSTTGIYVDSPFLANIKFNGLALTSLSNGRIFSAHMMFKAFSRTRSSAEASG